ncbi:amidohydrolase family protein [Tenacibaculum sp. E3R01]|uniref:amidohydrolase family protein n=1 Tax=Tenacibaculum sp. E3R01 TaxID=2267227 RepID=UPI0011BF916B|nr:amidohydrolase family protein [Tenacibaculum sp. E3R01]
MKERIIIIILLLKSTIYAQNNFDGDFLFKNVSLITMKENKLVKNSSLLIKGGKIKEIFSGKLPSLKVKQVIDLEGKFVMPTLSDAHVHLPKDEKEFKKYLILNLINGVTNLRSMRGKWEHLKFRNKYNAKGSIYPKLFLSAPPISRRYEFTKNELVSFINAARKFDFIKILSIKNEKIFKQLDSLCKKENISIGGHFPSNINDKYIFNSKYKSFEHLGGLVTDDETFKERLSKIKEKNIFICPTLSWYDIGSGRYNYKELRNMPGMNFIAKETIDNWIVKTKAYRNKIGKKEYEKEVKVEIDKLKKKYIVIKKLYDVGVKMLLSPDSSSKYMVPGFGMIGEMKLLKKAGLTNYAILEMATKNYAKFLKQNRGTLELNKEAEFLVLNKNPLIDFEALGKIESIFLNNQILTKKDIEALSKSISFN